MVVARRPAILTIVSNNYLHFARTMLQSARRHHPDATLYCVIVDRDRRHASALRDEFEAIWLDQLQLPLGEEFLFQYGILELNTAVKPWAIAYLFSQGHDTVVYVDPDICFYRRMHEVEQMLATGTDVVLTPHLLAPIEDDKHPGELEIRQAGAYNLGFCALRDSENTRAFVRWWQTKLTRDCISDLKSGLFVDQSWVDLVPGLFDNVGILRHPGYNVAYWNIAQRALSRNGEGGYDIGADPLVFFHFSGLNPADPSAFSIHQSRFTLSTVGLVRDLVDAYLRTVAANGYGTYVALDYDFGRFSDGQVCPKLFRSLYRQSSALRERMGPRPFEAGSALLDFWPEAAPGGIPVTNAMMAVWHARDDLRSEFPLSTPDSILAFYHWFVSAAPQEQYFSAPVALAHRTLITRFVEESKKARLQDAEPGSTLVGPDTYERVRHLYKHLLNRIPDPGGMSYYGEMCRTDAGLVRAWGEMGLSVESKRRPFLWFRMLKALLLVIMRAGRGGPPRRAPLGPSGLFPGEADAATNGVWVSDRVVMPVTARAGDRISLTGTYFPELVERQHGSPEGTLRLLMGTQQIHDAQLKAHGDFQIECRVPPSQPIATALTLEFNRVFVPKHLGLGDDERRLAWRLKQILVGEVAAFECARDGHGGIAG